MPLAVFLVLFLLIPTATGAAVQVARRPETWSGSRRLVLRATIGLLVVSDVIGTVTTPDSACGGTGCDTGYAVGLLVMAPFVYGLAFLGAWIGRLAKPVGPRPGSAAAGRPD